MSKKYQLSNKQKQELKRIINLASDYSAKEVVRAQVILLLAQAVPLPTILLTTGYQRRQIFEIRQRYFVDGLAGILDKRKGKPPCLLSQEQREEVLAILTQATPMDFGYAGNFWATDLLADLIEARYGVRYASKTSYYLLFKEATFSYHKPGRVYQGRDEKVVTAWREAMNKRLQKAWQDEKTVILTEDEMILSTQTTTQKVWLKQGDYPKIEIATERQRRSLYGFLNIKTGEEHAIKQVKQNSEITLECLKKIRRRYKDAIILLLWDNATWHRSAAVKHFLKKDKQFEVFPFPAYSPEENPQEHVWKTGRAMITHNRFIEDIDEATNDFIHYLNHTKFNYKLLDYSAVS